MDSLGGQYSAYHLRIPVQVIYLLENMISFNVNYHFKGPISKYSHTGD